MQSDALKGGFAEASVQSAKAFRAAMNAMARPGRIELLDGAQPPAPMSPAAGALVLTLCDPETPIHLAGLHDCPDVRAWITFHTGAPIAEPDSASFVLGNWPSLHPLSRFPKGTPEYPDRSATLIVEMLELSATGARLSGPGIRGVTSFALPELASFQENAALYPLGLDFFFTCGSEAAALPRSTKVEGI